MRMLFLKGEAGGCRRGLSLTSRYVSVELKRAYEFSTGRHKENSGNNLPGDKVAGFLVFVSVHPYLVAQSQGLEGTGFAVVDELGLLVEFESLIRS
jgi:hypothetical protein